MPYDTTLGAFTSPESERIQETAREVLCTALAARLNAPESPLAGRLSQPVNVTHEAKFASAQSKKPEAAPAIVFVLRGKRDARPWGRNLPDGSGSTFFRPGQRYDLTFRLDCATNNPAVSDTVLADALCDAIEDHVEAFNLLGLHNIEIEADQEAQNAGSGRNPHLLRCLVFALPTP